MDYYFSNNGSDDEFWNNADNWWTDSQLTIPLNSVPSPVAGDNVFLQSALSYAYPLSINFNIINNSTFTNDGGYTVINNGTFTNNSGKTFKNSGSGSTFINNGTFSIKGNAFFINSPLSVFKNYGTFIYGDIYTTKFRGSVFPQVPSSAAFGTAILF